MLVESFLVSGGSGGIGAAVCRQLGKAGYRPVVGFTKSQQKAEVIAEECGGTALKLDLADDKSVDAAVDQLSELEQPLAGLLLAGSPPPVLAAFGKIEKADLAAQWQVNVTGCHRLVAALVGRIFRPQKRGIVIGVLSEAMGEPCKASMSSMGSYIIAKYGLLGLLSAAAADYPWLSVDAIRPGFTRTAMLDIFDSRFIDSIEEKTGIVAPEDIANEVLAMIHKHAGAVS